MKLLHTQIDVEPGRNPMGPTPEGQVGMGSAVLRLQNATSRENAYTVRLRCENPFWQEAWFTINALPPSGNENSASGKPDQPGPQKRSVKVYVPRNGTRDILISFAVPLKPESRAGRYDFKVIVETYVSEAGANVNRKERFAELPAEMVIRPFYRWNADMAPEEGRRVGKFRSGADFEAVITNTGNDWLYCNIQLPRGKDMMVTSPTQRVSIPPPERGEDQTQRTVPIRVVSKTKLWRGERVPNTVSITAARVDAPTVPPLAGDGLYGSLGASAVSSVLAQDTGELQATPADRTLTYCPPIPATLTGCLGAIAQNGKQLIFTLIGLIALLNLALFMYEFRLQSMVRVQILQSTVKNGGTLDIRGSYIKGADVWLNDVPVEKADTVTGNAVETGRNVVQAVNYSDYIRVKVPKDFDNKPDVLVTVRRASFLPWISLLLQKQIAGKVTIGKPPMPILPRKVTMNSSVAIGDITRFMLVEGPPFPTDKKPTVMIGAVPVQVKDSDANAITITIPNNVQLGSQAVVITLSDGGKVDVNPLTVMTQQQKQAALLAASNAGPPGSEVQPGNGSGSSSGTSSDGGSSSTSSSGSGSSSGGGPIKPPVNHGSSGNTGSRVKPRTPVRPFLVLSAYDALMNYDDDKALKLAESAISRNGQQPEALAIKAYVLIRQSMVDRQAGKDDSASVKLSEANALVNRARAIAGTRGRAAAVMLSASGYLTEISQKQTEAIKLYGAASAADPTVFLPYLNLMNCYLDEGKDTWAKDEWTMAKQNVPPGKRNTKGMRSIVQRHPDFAREIGL